MKMCGSNEDIRKRTTESSEYIKKKKKMAEKKKTSTKYHVYRLLYKRLMYDL